EPALLLPRAHRLLVAPHVACRQAVAQPALGLTDELHLLLLDADLLLELAVQRLLEGLTAPQAPLRELPAAAGTPAEEHLGIPHEHDTDVGAEAVRVDDVVHLGCQSLPQGA